MVNSTLQHTSNQPISSQSREAYDLGTPNGLNPASYDLMLSERSRILVITVEDDQVTYASCHVHASKQITVLGGCAEIKLRDSCKKLYEGQSIYIPNGTIHKIKNFGKIPLKYVEIRTGPYVLDDDQLI